MGPLAGGGLVSRIRNGTRDADPPIPFDRWAPIPRWIFAAERQGDLTQAEAHLLKGLYERASGRSWIVRARDLEHLVWLVVWPHSADYLSRTLGSLRERGLIAYETKPGRRTHPYAIRLLHLSEEGPSSPAEPSPSTSAPGNRMVERSKRRARQDESEQVKRVRPGTSPSSGHPSPSSERGANAVAEPDRSGMPEGPFRAARDASSKAKALHEEGEEADLGEGASRAREGTGPDGTSPVESVDPLLERIAASRARSADGAPIACDDATIVFEIDLIGSNPDADGIEREIRDLLADGTLETTPPLCRYPRHRAAQRDWATPDGRAICGLCHPRARA